MTFRKGGEPTMKWGRIALYGLAVAAVAVTLTQLPDIQRYIKMKMM